MPAFFVLTGHYRPSDSLAVVAAAGYAALFATAFALGRRGAGPTTADLRDEARERAAA